jgi:hypothetical protein
MTQHTVFVLESRHRWAPELERQFSGENVRVRGIRKVTSAGDRPSGGCVIVADLESAATESLALLAGTTDPTAGVSLLVIGATAQASLEWPVRELGAVGYLTEPVSGEDLAALCRKQWAGTPRTAAINNTMNVNPPT